jgi:hypothetical protein
MPVPYNNKCNSRRGIPVQIKRVPGATALGDAAPMRLEITNGEEIFRRRYEALAAIAKQHGEEEYSPLALKLAFKHEPDLQYYLKKDGGRPEYWHDMRSFFLWWDVEHLRQSRGLSISAACKHLPGRNGWDKKRDLRAAYYERALKSPLTRFVQNLITLSGWSDTAISLANFVAPEQRRHILARADLH